MNIPDEELEDDVAERKYLARLRYLAKLKEHFWSRWRKEYLTDLREYHKLDHAEPDRVIQLGEPVFYEEKVSRCNWKMEVVEKLVVGKHGRVRGAKVKLIAKGKPVYMDRPIQKLYPLEGKAQIARNDQQVSENVEEPNTPVIDMYSEAPVRSKRAAAVDSGWKTRQMLEPWAQAGGVCGGAH